jgi:hypothetical protein
MDPMRRIDAILIVLAVFGAGGAAYVLLKLVGVEEVQAGIWSQVALTMGLIGWTLTYLYRAMTKTMSYQQQRQEYEDALILKRYEDMSPEQKLAFQAELESDRAARATEESPS